ncbi:MAG: low affinity iron permease family protein [Sphingomicrobium sp.]
MPNGKTNGKEKSAFERIGCEISSWVSDLAANPIAQIIVVVVCSAWFVVGLQADILTAVLSILAITLTQMVLNRQNEREADAHRRDVAMHAKIDELVIAVKGARNEMAGIEELEEDQIEELKEDAKQAIDDAGATAGTTAKRTVAKKAIDSVGARPKARTKSRTKASTAPRKRAALAVK